MNKISKKILEEAENRAMEIRAESLHTREEINEQHKREMIILVQDQSKMLDGMYRHELERILALINIGIKKKILSVKWDIIDEIRTEAEKELKNDSVRYAKFLKKVIIDGVVTGNEEIIVSEEDRIYISQVFLDAVNERAAVKTGKTASLKLSDETREIDGGLFLREDKIEFNATVNTVFRKIFERYEIEIGKMIFGG